MPLNRRQDRLYEDLADVYEPEDLEVKTGTTRMKDRQFAATPIATNIRCMFLSKPESAQGGGPIGRSEKDLVMFTLDRFRFAADAKRDDGTALKVDDGFLIQLKTPGHPDVDGWWICQGGSKIRVRRARRNMNVQSVQAKRTTKPYGVA